MRLANIWGQAFQIKGKARAKGREQEVAVKGQITHGVGNHLLCSVWWESLETRKVHDCIHILKGLHWLLCGEQAKGRAWTMLGADAATNDRDKRNRGESSRQSDSGCVV